MALNGPLQEADPVAPGPGGESSRTRWQKFRLVVKVVELRLRFVALMGLTALTFAYWDDLGNRYEKWMRPATASQAAATSGVEHYCPMHPQVVQDAAGTCPICGMPLAKRKKGGTAAPAPGVTARVQLAPFRVAQAGIRTAEVGYAPLAQTVTTVGYVAFDERRMANIVSKAPGRTRVEKLLVNVTGQKVEVGQVLAELYSPELSLAVQELLSAARRAGPSRAPQTDVARSLVADRNEMVRASSEKLRRWGVTPAQVEEILRTGKSDMTIPILSPIRGLVFKKNVVEGQEVPEGFAMFEVADLDTVWVQAQVFEHQLGLIHEGQAVEAAVEAYPGKAFPGKVEFIQPRLDPATRAVEVRFALKNPGHRLRPGLYATVTLRASVADLPEYKARVAARGARDRSAAEQKICLVTDAKLGTMGPPVAVEVGGHKIWTCCAACPPEVKANPAKYLARITPPPADEVLSVPESAVIDTGTRKVVYVETGPGVFDGREVVLGPRSGDRFPVLEGLAPGEKVAATGAFLIDAESRINPGPAAPSAPAPAPAEPAHKGHAPHKGAAMPPRSAAVPTDGSLRR